VGFSIGTDTGGSVVQPSSRNGITGLRPTFGRVSRDGGMVLAWTQDTVGPMCRSAEDCALVLYAIHGPDGRDNSVLDVPFNWDGRASVKGLRAGYLRSEFESEIRENPANPGEAEFQRATRANNLAALDVIRSLGVELAPFDLPDVPVAAIDFIRYAETAAFFDDVTRSGALRAVEQGPERSARPIEIRAAYFTPAVAFIQANRFRTRAMEQIDAAMSGLDLFIGSRQLLTNRTGHPVVSLPSGFHRGMPTALHFTGQVLGDETILRLAQAFQGATDHHLKRPPVRR
jgi:Asp-tRNA(Asn)/Glu-tRNA(Gln) amidotransferase A subunit family amidase